MRPLAGQEHLIAWTDDLDGRIGEGWGGPPGANGAHVNVVLAARGTPTAAALLTTFTSPAPGHTPILVVVGEDQPSYEPVWPPTIMINKATATHGRHQTITWGAGQLGIAQGVLDAGGRTAAAGQRRCARVRLRSGSTRRLRRDAVRTSTRAAVRKAIGVAVHGRDSAKARALVDRRDELTSPFYGGQ